ncbi:hypothetical protein ACT4US_33745, partial [Bacillus sp. HC-Mk]
EVVVHQESFQVKTTNIVKDVTHASNNFTCSLTVCNVFTDVSFRCFSSSTLASTSSVAVEVC